MKPKNSYSTTCQFFIGIFFILLSSCSESNEPPREEAPNSPMAQLLKQRELELASISSPYAVDDNTIKKIREMIKTADKGKALEARFYLAKNLLFYGDAEGSIKELESLLVDLNQLNVNLPPNQLGLFFSTLGLSYLRLGEELNCVDNANESTCIIPIAKDGIHTIKSASEAAISNFEFALQVNPKDYETIWLLNLAHMTLGTYPEGVQSQYLIDPKNFQNENDFPKFSNQGIKSGAGDNRLSGGCVIEDFNNDSFLDIMVSSWGYNDPIKIYINKGNGKFDLMPEQESLKGINGGLNMVSTDYNNDGHIDVLVLRGAWLSRKGCIPNSLLKGNGDGTFEDVTLDAGLTGMYPTQTAVWTDIDLDGNIDLFIGNENQTDENFPSEFYYNNGDGTFTNIASQLGLDVKVWVKGCSAGDANNDGFTDIYISNFKGDNYLFIHNGATEIDKIKFTNQAKERGVYQPFSSFATWFFDFNQDGFEDIFIIDYEQSGNGKTETFMLSLMDQKQPYHPRIYLNDGKGYFKDISEEAGLTEVVYAMGSNFGDLNYDGFPDFYLSTGSPQFTNIYPNKMFLNKNGKKVEDISYSGGFGHLQKGHAVGFADLDNDGDQDVYNVIGGAFPGDNFNNALFVNPGNNNSYLYVTLEGKRTNKAAIGSKIEVFSKDSSGKPSVSRKVVTWGGSFGCSPIRRQEIGLGTANTIDSVRIHWANKDHIIQTFTGVETNTWIKISESDKTIAKLTLKNPS